MKIDQHELALRMLEAAVGFRRPPNMSAEDALRCGPENLRHAYGRAAQAATVYFMECAGPLNIISNRIEDQDPSRERVQ